MKHLYQRLLIRASLVHIGLGVLLGVLLYLAPVVELPFSFQKIRSVHVHLILLGGVIQMIMGVALWMFPRMLKAPHYTSPHQGMLLFVIFNSGVVLRSVFELIGRDPIIYYYFALLGVLLQVIGMLFFSFLIYSRIRMPGGSS